MSVPAAVGVTISVPLVACVPIHAPAAEHAVALVEDQVSVAVFPSTTEVGATAKVTVGAGAVTVTLTAVDVDALFALSPPYAAVTEWVPTPSVLVVTIAMPVPFAVPVPRTVAPSLKMTDPVGTAVPGFSATVAVKVIAVPAAAVAGEADSVVVVGTVRMILATKPLVELPPPTRPYPGVCWNAPGVAAELDSWPTLPAR